jgi:glucose-6-phosphate 1-epimerase
MKPEPTIEDLRATHAIPGVAEIVTGNGGLPKVAIHTPLCSGEIYLHGAHVTSWRPSGAEETLLVSKESHWEDGRAIRGGIPICFPWFRNKADNPQAPQHGFARTTSWTLDSILAEENEVTVTMSITSNANSRSWWPEDFKLVYCAKFGALLTLELEMENTGQSSYRFEEALHTYHRIGNAAKVRIEGLDGVAYLDNTDSNRRCLQQGPIEFTSQVDRAYLGTDHPVQLFDPQMSRSLNLAKTNSLTTVIWNPWKEGAHSIADMADDEWTQMACIEASNIRDFAIDLAPGQKHTMKGVISLAKL